MAAIPVDLNPPTASSSGLLAGAGSLPTGWTRGISFLDTNCLNPSTVGPCPSRDDLKPTNRPESATFSPVNVLLGVECTALGNLDVTSIANSELDRTRDTALARELLTGNASRRDANAAGSTPDGNPALVTEAADLGTFATTQEAIRCLERSLSRVNGGRGGVILAPMEFAAQAYDDKAIYRDGATWRTVFGTPFIISPGFDGRAPAAPGGQVPPAAGDPLYAYITTAVWAGAGPRDTYEDVDRSDNTTHARAEDVMMAVFSPCAVFAAGAMNATACATPEPVISSPADGATVEPLVPFTGTGCDGNQEVQLWVLGSGGPRQIDSVTSDVEGNWTFIGTTPLSLGTHEFWVVCGGVQSEHITVIVEETP